LKHLLDVINLGSQSKHDCSTAMKLVIFSALSIALLTSHAQQRTYEVPPSSNVVNGSIPGISDKDMKKCVEIYNEAAWLKNELNNSKVDLAQPGQVESYNYQASLYSQMADYYNNNCAGKQSNLAHDVVQQLNQQSNE